MMAILNEDFESGKGKALQDKISSQHEQSIIPVKANNIINESQAISPSQSRTDIWQYYAI